MANDSVIGLLRVLLTANTAEFGSAMKTATGDVQTFAREATKAGEQGSKGLGGGLSGMVESLGSMKGLLIGGGIIGGIVALGKGFVDAAGQVNDLSERLGVSTTAVQRWQYAADQTGASVDDVAVAMGKLSKGVEEGTPGTIAAFEKIGLSIDQVRQMDPETLFETTAESIGKIQDPTQRSAVALELFGKGGAKLLPAITEGFKNLGDQAEATGNVMSADVVKAGDDLGDTFSSLLGSGKVLVATVLAPLVPLLSLLATGLAYVVGGVHDLIAAVVDLSKSAFDQTLRDAAGALEEIGLKAEEALPKVAELAAKGDATIANMGTTVQNVGIDMKDLDKITADLTKTAEANRKEFDRLAEEGYKKAVAAANDLNKSQDALLEKMRAAGIMTQGVIATGLAPLIEKLNLAAQVGTQQLGATLDVLAPQFETLRKQIVAAGGDVAILDGIWQGFNTTAGRTNQAFEDLEQSFPRLPFTAALGPMKEYDATAEIATANTEAMTRAFHDFGLKTPEELAKVARAARENYEIVRTTAGVSKDAVKKAYDEMIAAQDAYQGKVKSSWLTEILPTITSTVKTIQTAIDGSFAQMILGAKGFKDGFLDIWKSLKQGVMKILTEILQDFTDRFLRGLLAALTGAKGGFAGAFSGLFGGGGGGGGYGGLIGNLIKGGAGTAAAGAGGIGATGAVVGGTGVEAGIPIWGAASGAGTPVAGAGGVGGAGLTGGVATMAGGALIGGAGFGLGALGQKFFGRGAGAATFGGASGAGAGALIGTMVFPGVGTAIGALIGGLAGVAGGLVNFGPSKKEKAARGGVAAFQQDTFSGLSDAQKTEAQGAVTSGAWTDATAAGTLIAVRDAYLAVGKSAKDAETDVKKMWDAEKKGPEATADAMQPMLEALDEYKKKQQEAADQTTATTDQQVQAFETYTDEFGQVWTVVGGILGKVKGDLNDTAVFAATTGQTIQTAFGRAFGSAITGADDLSDHLGDIRVPEIKIPYGYYNSGPAIQPLDSGGSRTPTPVNVNITAMDGQSVARVVQSPAFGSALAQTLPTMLSDNVGASRTNTRTALGI